MSASKYDTPYYQENPGMAAGSRVLDNERESEAVDYAAKREQLRIEYEARHRNGCAVFKAHKIPFQSCGTCRTAFDEACERVRP